MPKYLVRKSETENAEIHSPDLDCIQAVCDAMDWKLEGRVVGTMIIQPETERAELEKQNRGDGKKEQAQPVAPKRCDRRAAAPQYRPTPDATSRKPGS